MARKPRIKSPTDYYHIMMRGNNKEKIFKSISQRNFFRDCMKLNEDEETIDIIAYCIMDNHVHLVLKADFTDLSKYLKRISTKYAVNFNNQNDRVGHVFQGRFRSEAIYDDKYLYNVIRYIHNNPVKANIVTVNKDYIWSSYIEYMGVTNLISKDRMEFILGCFGGINQFVEFHKLMDSIEYLDTVEDIEEYRSELSQKIIESYFKVNGINELKEITNKPNYIEEISRRFIDETNFSNRQISRILNISHITVNSIKRNNPMGSDPIGFNSDTY